MPYEQIHRAHANGTGPAVIWDLTLRLPGAAEPIRIGRVIGDVVERHKIDVFPVVDRVRPYLTKSGHLAIKRAT
ncbi:hypothetical protein NKH77_31070 [Streptomyces sp. M19]